MGNDSQFAAFADILGRPDLAEDARFKTNPARVENRPVIVPILEELIQGFTRDGLMAECEKRGVPAGPVHDLGDVFKTDQVAARDMVVSMDYPLSENGKIDLIGNPLKFSETPVSYRNPPPQCGEHSDAILKDWLGDEE